MRRCILHNCRLALCLQQRLVQIQATERTPPAASKPTNKAVLMEGVVARKCFPDAIIGFEAYCALASGLNDHRLGLDNGVDH
mmetsp:Transcript_33571/g.62903  ORF Transcript_33571/g.62903 Transcript_33571/m.62903 type:complete len:82 (+) Transcript_33571:51-296(+)